MSTSKRKQRAARLTDQREDKIKVYQTQLARMRQLGVLVQVKIGGISMLTTAASHAEFGIADQDERSEQLYGGRRYMFPPEVVKRARVLETRFRQITDAYSFPVDGFYPYKWIPFTAYEAWRREFDRLSAEWEVLKREVLADYWAYTDALAASSAAIARRAWRAVKSQKFGAWEVDGEVFKDEDAFVDHVMTRAVAKMPTKARLKTEMVADYRTAVLDDDEPERGVDMNFVQEGAAVAKLEGMRQAEYEHARKLLDEIGSPLDEVFGALRARVKRDVSEMLDSIQKNGFLKGKVAEKGAGLVEFFDLMSVHDDGDLRAKLSLLKQAIGPIGDERRAGNAERDIEEITQTLTEIAALADAEVDNSELDNRFQFIEVKKPLRQL